MLRKTRKLLVLALVAAFFSIFSASSANSMTAAEPTDEEIVNAAVQVGLLDRATAEVWVKDPSLKLSIPTKTGLKISPEPTDVRILLAATQTKTVTRYFENILGQQLMSNTLTKRWCYDGSKVCGGISSSVSWWRASWNLAWVWAGVSPDDKEDYYYTYNGHANGAHKTRRVGIWEANASPERACIYLHIWAHYDGTSTPTGSSGSC